MPIHLVACSTDAELMHSGMATREDAKEGMRRRAFDCLKLPYIEAGKTIAIMNGSIARRNKVHRGVIFALN